ncbi:galactose ABC transporter substrate-binding protein [Clostridium tertium]|uniref:galactose ABC transporter substrate-binding protein n=1 Tax=Clostridium tertium TaxID=1559 RepID=UPI00232C1712|nr:galactose ABC transporter substrate-binding protein [Clostridium tertium]MDB1955749.1 galactose ABC transporter substrate-binding protein [Clostridium tertium]MDB1957476.1 galactose ABC transporter substrate-binding protein [Clostridium tertium]MDB1961414.1 galactose ABC transporter substrate-binding protein [Clostridium tertium]MDB1966972.1 galactose ABC transporter substrate-binding protein [Clostridium tertium]
MKKGKRIINIFSLMLISTLIVGYNKESNIKFKKEIKIGVTLYKQDDTFISTISKNLEEIVKENESVDKSKIILDFVDAKGSTINQGNQVDKFINQDYDVICVNLVDRTAASTIIDKAKSADIPLIFFNREPVEEDMNRWDKLYYVGAQAEQSARLQAEIVLDEWLSKKDIVDKNKDNKIQYVMLEGEPGHQDSSIRTEYCIKSITEKGVQLEKLADDSANWQSDQAISKMNQWIKEFGDKIEVVFSNNDVMALGAIHAINSSDVFTKKPTVVGIDGIKEAMESVKKGEMIGTVISDSKAQAQAIFDIAIALAKGNDIQDIEELENNKYIKVPHTKVTKSNVDLYMENEK